MALPAYNQNWMNPAGGTAASSYNINPMPQSGSGAFGGVPGTVGLPDPFSDISSVYPNLSKNNATQSGDILSQLHGEMSPGVLMAMNEAADRYGLAAPDLSKGDPLHSLGIFPEQLQRQGLGNFEGMMGTLSKTQTVSPEEQAMIAQFNAHNAAAPDPEQSAMADAAFKGIGSVAAMALL